MKRKLKIILIDMDGVIANFDRGLVRVMKKELPEIPITPYRNRTAFYFKDNFDKKDYKKIQEIERRPGFFKTLPIVPNAKEAISEISKRGHNVKICSSPLIHNPTCASDKYSWLEEKFGSYLAKQLIITKDKTLVKGDILIDDRPEIRGNYTPKWEYVLFDRPYNKYFPGRRINWSNWKSVLTEL